MTPTIVARLSVRARLTLWNVAVVAVALTLFGTALRFGVHRILLATVDRDLAMRMERDGHRRGGPRGGFNGPPGEGPGQGPDGLANQELDSQNVPDGQDNGGPPRNDNDGGARLPDPRPQGAPDMGPPIGGVGLPPRNLRLVGGVLVAQRMVAYAPDAAPEALRTRRPVYTTLTTADGQTLRVLTEVVSPPGSAEEWVTQMPTTIDFITAADHGVTTTLLLLLPAALLLTGAGGLLLTNRALRPVDALGRLLGRIQAQNLKERVPDAGQRDEFGRLNGVVNAMLGRLDDAFERQRRFAADASHELRTPLATIRASSSLALDPSMGEDAFTPDQYRAMLARIDTAADRATRVTQDLLFLARVGSLPVRQERLSLSGVLGEARGAVLTAARTASATADRHPLPEITLDAAEDLRVDSDRDHLLRLFINLIDNAARHTPPTGRVHVQARLVGSAVTIAVIDNGEGIAPEHLAHIREPFYRPDNARSRRSGGAGLGLAITQGIVDSLHGTLHIDSALGAGTTVTVTLPV